MVRFSASTPFNNATIRTTCVATTVTAGHAANALAQRAQATVNCRILPGETVDQTRHFSRSAGPTKTSRFRASAKPRLHPQPVWRRRSPARAGRDSGHVAACPLIPTLSPGRPMVVISYNGHSEPMASVVCFSIRRFWKCARSLNESLPVRSLYEGHQFYMN